MANDKVTLKTKIVEPPVTGDEKMIHDPFKKKPKNPKVKMARGGKAEGKMMKSKGRNVAKATMQRIADKKVKSHEARMHKGKK